MPYGHILQPSVTPPVPTKAYLITYAIVNEMEGVVWARSAADALKRFQRGEGVIENTGNDWRLRKPRVRRYPREDR